MPKIILVADDSTTIRRVVELTFLDSGFRVETVGSGEEALEHIDALSPDLVLADVLMPGPNGYDICRRIKSSDRPIPVLLLTGTFEPYDPEHARDCGADGCIVKPFESASLLSRVQDLLHPSSLAGSGSETRAESAADEEVDDALDVLAGIGPARPQVEPPAEGVEEEGSSAEPAPPEPPSAGPAMGAPPVPARLTADEIEALARSVVERLSDRVIREIAWEVVPDLAEILVRERIRELERSGD